MIGLYEINKEIKKVQKWNTVSRVISIIALLLSTISIILRIMEVL